MEDDEWGRDPSVRGMRHVFAAIETAQARLLDRLSVPPMDKRLAAVRKMALHLFEQHWARAVRNGMEMGEQDVADLYVYCLGKVLETKGVAVPKTTLPGNRSIETLMEEKK